MTNNICSEDGLTMKNLDDLRLMIHLKLADKTKDYCYTRHWFLLEVVGFLDDYKGLLGNDANRLSDSILQKDIDRLLGKLKTTKELYETVKEQLGELTSVRGKDKLKALAHQKEAHKKEKDGLLSTIQKLNDELKELKENDSKNLKIQRQAHEKQIKTIARKNEALRLEVKGIKKS